MAFSQPCCLVKSRRVQFFCVCVCACSIAKAITIFKPLYKNAGGLNSTSLHFLWSTAKMSVVLSTAALCIAFHSYLQLLHMPSDRCRSASTQKTSTPAANWYLYGKHLNCKSTYLARLKETRSKVTRNARKPACRIYLMKTILFTVCRLFVVTSGVWMSSNSSFRLPLPFSVSDPNPRVQRIHVFAL